MNRVPGKEWFRTKGYLHFDNRVHADDISKVESLVSDRDAVAKHAFYPLIRFYKPKFKVIRDDRGKVKLEEGTRPLCYSAHLDSLIYSFYSQALSVRYEDLLKNLNLSENVIAFRKLIDQKTGDSKSNIHLANDAFEAIKSLGEVKVFAFDIRKFFDTLDPRILKRAWKSILGVPELPDDHYNLFKALTNFSFVDRELLFDQFEVTGVPNRKKMSRVCSAEDFRKKVRGNRMIQNQRLGIPQGTPISAVLANIYMLSFDVSVAKIMNEVGGKYFRYCDDILCIVPSNSLIDVEQVIVAELAKIELSLNTDKTEDTLFFLKDGKLTSKKPIQYLGFVFDGQRKFIRPGSIYKYRREAKAAFNLSLKTQDKFNRIRRARGEAPHPIYLKKFYRKYTHVGSRNFISYGLWAADIMKSQAIRQQMKKLSNFIEKELVADLK